ncbi:cystathionine beta-lyase [Pseudohaliea rubra]|nr:cystathionine beta-lyase [Pseudohaliea rubra]
MKADRVAPETRLVHDADTGWGIVATPVYRASTVLFDNYAALKAGEEDPFDRSRLHYGRMGVPTTRALEDALAALDGSAGAVLSPSGLGAIADVLQCFLRPGDHLLMPDSCYGPTRSLCRGRLAGLGIKTTFYDPLCGAAIRDQLRLRTRMVFLESPGSATFEVQDVAAIAAVAREAGALTAIDNTWATPLLFNPLEHGVDLAIQSGTKYLNGHADVMFGVTTTADPDLYERLRRYVLGNGVHLAPDDAWLARRGLRTLAVRLAVHERAAYTLAEALAARPEVAKVLHPGLPDCPGHASFRRDFRGASGLFAIVLNGLDEAALARFVDGLELFGMGYSWGGFESLVLPMTPTRDLVGGRLAQGETLLRVHAGLEAVDDLLADLDAAFARAYR